MSKVEDEPKVPKVVSLVPPTGSKRKTVGEALKDVIDMLEENFPEGTGPTDFAMIMESDSESFVVSTYLSQSDCHISLSQAAQMVMAPWLYYGIQTEED